MTTHIEYWNEHFDKIMNELSSGNYFKYSKLYPVKCPNCRLGYNRSNVIQWCPNCQKNVETVENNDEYNGLL
jgi:uncharacterized OB-fold protein